MSETRDYQQPDIKTMQNIIGNYTQSEKALVSQLYFKVSHGTTIGGFREDIWRGMFEQIVPKKFVIEQSVFIIDSEGRVSNEVDLAIFDETYTPYIFRYGRLKFLPIEAVAVVVECKSSSLKKNTLINWVKSVKALRTSRRSYTRTISRIVVGEEEQSNVQTQKQTQTATRPLRILCCLKEKIPENFETGEPLFDIIVRAPSAEAGLKIKIDKNKESLQDWYLALNHVDNQQSGNIANGKKEIGDVKLDEFQVNGKKTPVSLLTFNLQLNQLLMLINNPILFPHKAYAEMFAKYGKAE